MIGNKLEQSIIEVFQKHPSKTFSIHEVSKSLNKSYPNIHSKAIYFLKEKILSKIEIGNSYQCFLNMKSEKARVFMVMNELNAREAWLARKGVERQEIEEIARRFSIECMLHYKGTILFISGRDIREEVAKSTLLSRNYKLVFIGRKDAQNLFLEDPDFQEFKIVLFNATYFVEMVSELSDKLAAGFLKDEK